MQRKVFANQIGQQKAESQASRDIPKRASPKIEHFFSLYERDLRAIVEWDEDER